MPWCISDSIGNHPELETISLNCGQMVISPDDMAALGGLHMLGGVGTQFMSWLPTSMMETLSDWKPDAPDSL
jgi:hypothetical protein